MILAAFEASVRQGSLALETASFQGQRVLDEQQSHARDLLPSLTELLQEAGAERSSLELLVVGTGPGSFTGIRVAIATAQGLARAIDAALLGLPSLHAIACDSLEPDQSGGVLVDAYGGAAYYARYRRRGEALEVVADPLLVPLGDLPGVLASEPLFASEEPSFHSKLPAGLPELRPARPPRAQTLLSLGKERFLERGADVPHSIEPLYLRPFQAKPAKR